MGLVHGLYRDMLVSYCRPFDTYVFKLKNILLLTQLITKILNIMELVIFEVNKYQSIHIPRIYCIEYIYLLEILMVLYIYFGFCGGWRGGGVIKCVYGVWLFKFLI